MVYHDRVQHRIEADEEEIIDHSVRWKHAAELSVKAGDLRTLRRLLRGGRGEQDEDATTAAQLYSQVDPSRLDILLMELDPVHIACAAGHREMVRFILTEVAPWSVMSHDKEGGATALHTAARFGRVEIARDLLGYGAPVRSHDCSGCTPLHIACEHNNGNLVRLFLGAGAVVDELDKNHCTPLFTSVRAGGSPVVLQLLLAKGAAVDKAPDGEPTSLALASGMGCLKTVRLLASAGANLVEAAENLGGETALHLAAKNGSEDVLCFLLAAGCWPETKDADGRAPLASACAGGRAGTARVLLTGQGWSLDRMPDDLPPDLRRHVLSFLVASPDAADSSGNTALLSACEHRGTAAVLDLLAAHGANFNHRNKGGETALHVACRRGNAEMAQFLLGRQPLFLPARSAARGVQAALNTSCVDAKDARGRRPGEVRDIDVSHDEALAVREVIGRESVCAEEG